MCSMKFVLQHSYVTSLWIYHVNQCLDVFSPLFDCALHSNVILHLFWEKTTMMFVCEETTYFFQSHFKSKRHFKTNFFDAIDFLLIYKTYDRKTFQNRNMLQLFICFYSPSGHTKKYLSKSQKKNYSWFRHKNNIIELAWETLLMSNGDKKERKQTK
jgi:hypothetical protein